MSKADKEEIARLKQQLNASQQYVGRLRRENLQYQEFHSKIQRTRIWRLYPLYQKLKGHPIINKVLRRII